MAVMQAASPRAEDVDGKAWQTRALQRDSPAANVTEPAG
jgi:hypothetical protein